MYGYKKSTKKHRFFLLYGLSAIFLLVTGFLIGLTISVDNYTMHDVSLCYMLLAFTQCIFLVTYCLAYKNAFKSALIFVPSICLSLFQLCAIIYNHIYRPDYNKTEFYMEFSLALSLFIMAILSAFSIGKYYRSKKIG